MLRFLLVLLAVVLGCATALRAQAGDSPQASTVELAGRVLDRDGRPLAGAYVLLDIRRDKACRTASVRTDRDGAFRYTTEEPGEFTLSVVKPAHGRADLALGELAAGTRRTDLVLRLGAGNVIAGRVQFADGSPAEAFVTVSNGAGRSVARRGRSDPDGTFEIDGLGEGPFRVEATTHKIGIRSQRARAAGERVEPSVAQAVHVAAGARDLVLTLAPTPTLTGEDLVFSLAHAPRIFGRVLAPDGTPVVGAEIRLLDGYSAESKADGDYEVLAGNRTFAWLHARAEGFGPSEWVQIEFQTGPQQERDLHLRPSESIQGLVRDLGGIAADQAEVDARSPYGWRQARTGPDGRFVLTDLPPGEVELRARLVDGIGLERQVTVVAGTPCEVLLAPPSGDPIRLSGRVRVGDGSVPWSGYAQRDRERDTYPIVRADDGRYSLALPGAGAWEIHVACGRGQTANELHWRLALELGSESEPTVDLELPLVHLRGRVTDANGAPAVDCHLFAYQQREGRTRVIASLFDTDAEGRYDLLLSPGTFNLSVGAGEEKLELAGLVIGPQDPDPRAFVLASAPR